MNKYSAFVFDTTTSNIARRFHPVLYDWRMKVRDRSTTWSQKVPPAAGDRKTRIGNTICHTSIVLSPKVLWVSWKCYPTIGTRKLVGRDEFYHVGVDVAVGWYPQMGSRARSLGFQVPHGITNVAKDVNKS